MATEVVKREGERKLRVLDTVRSSLWRPCNPARERETGAEPVLLPPGVAGTGPRVKGGSSAT